MKLPYDHGLTNKITQSSDRERNERLYPRVMAGDEKAREDMIESNMPLVIVKVNSFLCRHSQFAYLRDDLHSAGFVGLVQAVNKMAEHVDPPIVNPTGYISVAITHEIGKLVAKEENRGFARVPKGDRETGKVPFVTNFLPESLVDPEQEAAQEVIEMRDLLESCCESDDERTILRMREKGHSDREIADAIGLKHTTTYLLRLELEDRFKQKCRELEED